MIGQKDLFSGCKISGISDGLTFTGISSDSRRAKKGDLFICHRGLHRDGREYAREATEKGAAAVLSDSALDGIAPEKQFFTDDTRLAESFLWHNFTGKAADRMKTVAVTGTAGKSSVVFILRDILRAAGHKVGVISTVKTLSGDEEISLGECGGSSVADIAGAMTTPDPEYFFGAVKRMADDGCDVLLYEASSQGLALKKTSAVKNDIAVFTNLSPEHLDAHGTMENYFAAKAELMKTSRRAVINADDPYISRLYGMYSDKEITRCTMQNADAEIYGVNRKTHGERGQEYFFLSDSAVFRLKTPLVGLYSAYNTLEAAASAVLLGVDPMTVRDALRDSQGADGRMTKVSTGIRSLDEKSDISVYIDYAHTPESLRSVITTARETGERITVLFGCGGDRDKSKRAPMGKIASEYADRVIVTSDNPRNEDRAAIISDILDGVDKSKDYAVIPDRRAATEYAIMTAQSGETVLLCGKGHEKYEITADGKHPYDEYAIASDALGERIKKKTNE